MPLGSALPPYIYIYIYIYLFSFLVQHRRPVACLMPSPAAADWAGY